MVAYVSKSVQKCQRQNEVHTYPVGVEIHKLLVLQIDQSCSPMHLQVDEHDNAIQVQKGIWIVLSVQVDEAKLCQLALLSPPPNSHIIEDIALVRGVPASGASA